MIKESFSYATGVWTLTCSECGHAESDPNIGWLGKWFRVTHKRVTV